MILSAIKLVQRSAVLPYVHLSPLLVHGANVAGHQVVGIGIVELCGGWLGGLRTLSWLVFGYHHGTGCNVAAIYAANVSSFVPHAFRSPMCPSCWLWRYWASQSLWHVSASDSLCFLDGAPQGTKPSDVLRPSCTNSSNVHFCYMLNIWAVGLRPPLFWCESCPLDVSLGHATPLLHHRQHSLEFWQKKELCLVI